jgi:hypothetical protein
MMATLSLSNKVKLDIKEDGKVIKTFNVTYRELTRKQSKKLGKDNKEILDIAQKGASLESRISVLSTKMKALEELGRSEEVVKVANTLDTLMSQRDEMEDKYEELGGIDKLTEAAEVSFNLSVGGKDKEALREFTDEY